MSVGSYPAGVSPYGVQDMAGNVAEWVYDWLDEEYYKHSPEQNPSGPLIPQPIKDVYGVVVPVELKVLRGGAWQNSPRNLRTAARDVGTPDVRNWAIGFRCARGSSR